MCPLYAAKSRLPILLPEYDPCKLTPIKVRADRDETHPKARIGCVMKNNCPYEYAFARTIDGQFDKTQDWEEYLKGEILHVRRGGRKRVWVKKGDRGEDNIWENNDVVQMRGLSKVTRDKLVRVGIKTVVDLKYLDNVTMETISKETRNNTGKGLTVSALRNPLSFAHNAHEGDPPQTVDHCQALNSYESLYVEQWKEKISDAVAMK
eukprot:3916573-Ditylum_brightwellii.AAC.1